MKNFFSSKLNILLTFLLIAVIGVGVYFGVTMFQKPALVCADFSEMTESEIASWVLQNEASELISVEYEYDELIPEGKVIYQSTKAGDELKEKCTIYISKGIDPNTKYEIITNENTTLDTLKEELLGYGITNFEIEYDESSDMEGIVLAVSPNPVSKNSNIKVTIGGKDPNKVEEENKNKVYIDETAYLGKTEAEFKAALDKLGFKNLVKAETGVYSPKRSKDVIAAYSPDGNQNIDTKITYYLSLGSYTSEQAKKDFEELTLTKAKELINTNKFSFYSYTLETTKTTVSDKKSGTLYDCSLTGTKIACKLASNGTSDTKATISEYGYLGKTEEDFKAALKKLGFTNVVKDEEGVYSSRTKGTIGAYTPDGEQPIDAKITYYLSLGSYTNELAKTDFVGKTLNEANALIKKDKFALLEHVLKTTETETKDHTNGTLYDCSVSGKTISCKLAKNGTGSSETDSKTEYIHPTNYAGNSETEFKNALKNLGFTNVVKDTNGTYSNTLSAGKIAYYDPDGNQKLSTQITYWLSLGQYSSAQAKTDFNGKTVAEANSILATKKYSLSGISSNVVTNEVETSDYKAGTLYDCSYSNKKVSCKLAKSGSGSSSSDTTSAYIHPTNYSGNSETEFMNALKTLGFTNVVKDSIGAYSTNVSVGGVAYYDPDGTQKLSTQITYWLSLGSYSSAQAATDFNGKTVAEANSILATKKYSISGISSTVGTTETETSSYTAGTLYDCSYSSKKVACKLAKAVSQTPTAYLGNLDYIAQNYSADTYSSAESKVNTYLTNQGFTNYTITGVSAHESVGQIVGVSVAGNDSYTAGQYAKNSAIEVKIVNAQVQ